MLNSFNFRALIATALLGTSVTTGSVNASPIIKIDGSSTVFPITEAVAEDFQIAKRGAIRVTVGIFSNRRRFQEILPE